jgi:glycosyltransferase involved in cell wall biosynthesis
LPRDRTDPVRAMRVAHVITDLDTGGAEIMLARLVKTFAGTTIDNAVISLGTRGPIGERIASAGIPVFSLGMRPDRPDPRALWSLIRLLRRIRPAIVQTWLYHADFAGLVAGTLARMPVVWNLRCAELDPRDHSRSLSTLLRALALASRYPAAVICNSHAGQRAHEQLGYMPRKWAIIPNGFDTDAFSPCPAARGELRRELGLSDDAPLVGLLARFHPMKDQATFLNAARTVSTAKPDVRIVMAGRGVDTAPALNELVDELALHDRVHLLPERHDPSRFLAALDVSVSSSYGEAFPNVLGEAMACGIPCVATDVGDSAHIVGDTGQIVPPRDPAALAAAILRLLDMDNTRRATYGLAARARIVSEFSLERAAGRYQELYRDIAGQSASAPDEIVCAE